MMQSFYEHEAPSHAMGAPSPQYSLPLAPGPKASSPSQQASRTGLANSRASSGGGGGSGEVRRGLSSGAGSNEGLLHSRGTDEGRNDVPLAMEGEEYLNLGSIGGAAEVHNRDSSHGYGGSEGVPLDGDGSSMLYFSEPGGVQDRQGLAGSIGHTTDESEAGEEFADTAFADILGGSLFAEHLSPSEPDANGQGSISAASVCDVLDHRPEVSLIPSEVVYLASFANFAHVCRVHSQ